MIGVNEVNLEQREDRPCFFIAMEVLDNFSHDVIRYDQESGQPLQEVVFVDKTLDFQAGYEPVGDIWIQNYLSDRTKIGYTSPLKQPSLAKFLSSLLPFSPALSRPEFLPTMAYRWLHVLRDSFPQHQLVMSDFYALPDAVDGVDGPVVQTRYQESMVACSTYLVQPGWFDIFFPTNFELLNQLYQHICGKSGRIHTHKEFIQAYGQADWTRTKSGENLMLEYYQNVKFLTG